MDQPQTMSKPKLWCYVIALIPPLAAAVSYVVSKFHIHEISPIALLFYRWALAVVILTPFALRPFLLELPEVRKHLTLITASALSGVTLFNFFTYHAVLYTSSMNLSIVVSLFPIFVLLFGVVLHKDSLQRLQILSILLSFAGAVIIISRGRIVEGMSGLFENLGDFIALMATLTYAIYVFSVKLKPRTLSFYGFVYPVFLIGTALIIPLYLVDVFYFEHRFDPDFYKLLAIFILGFGVSIIGMLSLNFSVLTLGPNVTAILSYFTPIFTAILAVLFLDEQFQPFHALGMGLILLGMMLPLIGRTIRHNERTVAKLINN